MVQQPDVKVLKNYIKVRVYLLQRASKVAVGAVLAQLRSAATIQELSKLNKSTNGG